MANANVRLVDPTPEQLDHYAPLTNEEWIHEHNTLSARSPGHMKRQIAKRSKKASGYTFEPRVVQEVARIGQEEFERTGSYEGMYETFRRELSARYPGQIARELDWTINFAGGARGRYALLHCSTNEYILAFNTPLKTHGWSGRYRSDIWDFVTVGAFNYYRSEHHEAIRKPAGTYTYLPKGLGHVYEATEGAVALEYARGFIPWPALDFGILRSLLFETGDWPVAWDQFKSFGKSVLKLNR